jgi:hypothetical protein
MASSTDDLLRRILGEKADALISATRRQQSDKALLRSHGIDVDVMHKRASAQITKAEALVAHGIHPPVPIEELTDEQFEALDTQTLERYLGASGIDSHALLAKAQNLIHEATPKVTWHERLQAMLPRWQSPPVLGMAVGAMALVAVGVGVLRVAPQESIPAQDEAKALALAKEVPMNLASRTAPQQGLRKGGGLVFDMKLVQTPGMAAISKRPVAKNMAKAVEPATADLIRPQFQIQPQVAAVAIPTDTLMALNQPAPEATIPVTNTVEADAAVSAPLASVDVNDALATPQWALTSAPNEFASEHKIEFIFKPGDTLSHSLVQSGLPVELWAKLAERVGSNFHPGDKAIIYFENDEFEQLVVIRRKKERTTVTADLKTNTVAVGTTTTIEVTGEIQTSLYVALEEKLNANVAQRIAWLLQSRDVPLTTLPKGSTFSVRIEQITGVDGETLRYGQISSVQLDAGGKGRFVVEGSGDVSA